MVNDIAELERKELKENGISYLTGLGENRTNKNEIIRNSSMPLISGTSISSQNLRKGNEIKDEKEELQ